MVIEFTGRRHWRSSRRRRSVRTETLRVCSGDGRDGRRGRGSGRGEGFGRGKDLPVVLKWGLCRDVIGRGSGSGRGISWSKRRRRRRVKSKGSNTIGAQSTA